MLNDLLQVKIKMMSRAAYENEFKKPGTLMNRLVRYVKSSIGKGSDAYCKLQKLLTDNKFVNIQESDNYIDWAKVKKVQL